MQRLKKAIAEVEATDEVDDLALELSMARGINEIMAVMRERVRPLVQADGVTFVLRENDMCYYAEEDAIGPLWKGQRFPMETCISGWSMLHREVAVIEDIYADDRIPHDAYRPTFVRSLVMVPVRAKDPVAAIGAYWAKRHRPDDAQVRLLRRLANMAAVAMTNVSLFQSLTAARDEALTAKDAVIMAMASLADTRDNEAGNHLQRTQHFIRALALAARRKEPFREELTDFMIDLLYKSAPLHDIGKVGIPDRILLKPGKLDAEEISIMRTHPELGGRAIAAAEQHFGTGLPFFSVAQDIAYCHHEKWDGSGYPRGLKGRAIPLAGRLMAIADVYDALVSKRVYKAAIPHAEAVELIKGESGRHFDPELVDVFLEIAPEFEAIHRRFTHS